MSLQTRDCPVVLASSASESGVRGEAEAILVGSDIGLPEMAMRLVADWLGDPGR